MTGLLLLICLLPPSDARAQATAPGFPATLTSARARLTVDDGEITVVRDGRLVVRLVGVRFNYFDALGWELVTATDDSVDVRMTFPPEVDHAQTAFDDRARETTLRISTVQGGFRLHAAPTWGRQTTLDLDDLGGHVFRLSARLQPENRLSPDLRGSVIDVEIDSRDATFYENYASVYSAFLHDEALREVTTISPSHGPRIIERSPT